MYLYDSLSCNVIQIMKRSNKSYQMSAQVIVTQIKVFFETMCGWYFEYDIAQNTAMKRKYFELLHICRCT
jgi:hypothetical protein